MLSTNPVQAERLRISPDDLRLRVAVSEVLEPSLRFQLKDLARTVPLPVKNGLVQTQELLDGQFPTQQWSAKRGTLIRYYFLVARMDSSQKFSDEFLRRDTVMKEGKKLADDYINHLNELIARAPYNRDDKISVSKPQSFPMREARTTEDGGMLLLHQFPKAQLSLGRENLRELRKLAESDRKLIRERIQALAKAERNFLDEISMVGQALIEMRPEVRKWVKAPGEGLPFSP